jgi:hypothetical protein
VQRKQQVGECWVCVIFFKQVVVCKEFFGPTYFRRFRADILSLSRHISGTTYFRDQMILGGFRHMVFADGFLFPVKELGFWTNPGHWVRVLDAAGSYMYIVL